jgi:hypothetical protein
MKNHIHNSVTQTAQRDGRAFPIVVIGLDVNDLASLDSFMVTVADTFRNQRMCSPPETTGFFVTLIGVLTAEGFKERWMKSVQADPILKLFMDQMTEATVLHGKPDGTVIDHISLI